MFRYLLLMVVTLLVASCQAKNPWGLEDYVGKDLRHHREVRYKLETLTGDKPAKNELLEPWWVKPVSIGKAKWFALEAYSSVISPGEFRVRIHVFDKDWNRITKSEFRTGNSSSQDEVTLRKDNPLKQELIVVTVPSTRQYYALLREQIVLVRLEDDAGRILQKRYTTDFGPPVPKATREEWIRSLTSDNPTEQLATLVWLSGKTRSPEGRARHPESLARLFDSVRDAPETKKALQELTRSSNPWVREYARFALQSIAQPK